MCAESARFRNLLPKVWPAVIVGGCVGDVCICSVCLDPWCNFEVSFHWGFCLEVSAELNPLEVRSQGSQNGILMEEILK
jgi:hypothetical protein